MRVLYVSPLKALNADIERNLREPLAELTAAFAAAGGEPPAVRVGVRSGDTPPAERARQLRRPPEILITTPESLNLLLLSARAAGDLRRPPTRASSTRSTPSAPTKRGTHLITAVDRLVRIAGEFQRVAISATVRPLDARGALRRRLAARARRRRRGALRAAAGPRRRVARREAVRPRVRHPFPPADEAADPRETDELWRGVAEDLRQRIGEARSTLVFTNSRRTAGEDDPLRQRGGRARARLVAPRLAVARAARRGRAAPEGGEPAGARRHQLARAGHRHRRSRPRCCCQAPRSLASAAQRIGRAGHRVGDVSRGAALSDARARLRSTARWSARAVLDGEIEPVASGRGRRSTCSPRSLLATGGAEERRALDELFDEVRASDPFHELSRRAVRPRGRDARRPLRRRADRASSKPRIALDRLRGTIEGAAGDGRGCWRAPAAPSPTAATSSSGSTTRGAQLGELDEEFVWERVGRRQLHPRHPGVADPPHHRATRCSSSRPAAERSSPRSGAPTRATAARSSPSAWPTS